MRTRRRLNDLDDKVRNMERRVERLYECFDYQYELDKQLKGKKRNMRAIGYFLKRMSQTVNRIGFGE